MRGTAQNPDTYFQSRETVNPFYDRTPGIVQEVMDTVAAQIGRQYHLVEYHGAEDAESVIVIMGSGYETVTQTVDSLNSAGGKVGAVLVRLYRPFPEEALLAAIPAAVKNIAVLDRTKEPGSGGEPLFLDVMGAFSKAHSAGELTHLPRLIGGRYGLSSKEFTPAMVVAVFDELAKKKPKPRFTVGIKDDVGFMSLDYDPSIDLEDPTTHRAVFYGLGSDGTVGANKNTIKILGSSPETFAQGYFVYDSKKSGSRTVSHLRFGPNPIKAPYLVNQAQFIGCHHWSILERVDVLEFARPGATLLINSPYGPDEVWDRLPVSMQQKIIDLDLQLYVIDANQVARGAGLGRRTNTVLQTCFFAISG
ncbi:MAG: pyruvate:ferredoxin (flavodoxin) oxidoreductase, partial [Propionibacterium sp.]